MEIVGDFKGPGDYYGQTGSVGLWYCRRAAEK